MFEKVPFGARKRAKRGSGPIEWTVDSGQRMWDRPLAAANTCGLDSSCR